MADADPPAPDAAAPNAAPPASTAPAQLSPDRTLVWNGAAWVAAQYSPDGQFVWDGAAWRPAPPPPPAPVASVPIAPPIEFTFPVGNQEKHTVRFHLEQSTQQLTVDVDGVFIVNETQQFNLQMVKTYNLTVGTSEPHAVIIEKKREVMMAGTKPYTFRVWIDGVYYGTFQGDGWLQNPA